MHATPIPLTKLVVSALNVRKTLDAGQEDSNIQDLAASIRDKGLLSPLTVRPLADGRFEILVGQRRYLACKLVPLDRVPCFVKEGLSDAEAISLSLIENLHRADMHPLEKAKAFQALFAKHGTYDGVARESACSTATIRRYLKLLDLHPTLREQLGTADGHSGISAMSRLASTFSGEDQLSAFNEIAGFTQRIQVEILKRSNGSLERLYELVEEAQEGVFDIKRCGAAAGCQLFDDIAHGRLSEAEFGDMIEASAHANDASVSTDAALRDAATAFWRALARVDEHR